MALATKARSKPILGVWVFSPGYSQQMMPPKHADSIFPQGTQASAAILGVALLRVHLWTNFMQTLNFIHIFCGQRWGQI